MLGGLFLWLIGPLPCVDEVVVIGKLLNSGGDDCLKQLVSTMKPSCLLLPFTVQFRASGKDPTSGHVMRSKYLQLT